MRLSKWVGMTCGVLLLAAGGVACEEETPSNDRGAANLPPNNGLPQQQPAAMQPAAMQPAGTQPAGTAGMSADGVGGDTNTEGPSLMDMVTMCNPPCTAGQICDTANGVCMMAPEVGCPGGCPMDQICMEGACVAAPSSGTVDMQCATDAMALNSTTTMECAACLCTAGTGCLAEISTCNSDGATCGDLVNCGATMGCNSACCFCDPASAPAANGPCGALGENINTGACAMQIAAAVGLTYPVDLLSAAGITDACAAGGGTACAHAGEFGACAAEKCSDVCNIAPECPVGM
jgi:hypothetical protein